MSMFAAARPSAVDDLDLLEQGGCKEVVSDTTMKALGSPRAWKECFVLSESKSKFAMYEEETGRLLLTAKRIKGSFYISQYEDFPESFTGPPKQAPKIADDAGAELHDCARVVQPGEARVARRRYCSLLKLNEGRRGYKLFSCSCELCDDHLHRFSCGTLASDEERQVLAIITHRTKLIQGTDVEARCFDVQMPALLGPHRHADRVVWCPRTMAEGVHSNVMLANERLRKRASSVSMPEASTREVSLGGRHDVADHDEETKSDCDDSDEETDSFDEAERRLSKSTTRKHPKQNLAKALGPAPGSSANSDRVMFETKLPKWSDDIGSLVLKFRNGRVLMASSKNFILADKADPSRIVFQLGKADAGRFNLDFRHPMSPLQAFGIALSAYGFAAKPK